MPYTNIRRSSRRSPCFTTSSSLVSMSFYVGDSSSPATPLRYSGIPFSWEQFPGIPKKNDTNKVSCSSLQYSLLPLPPSGNSFRKSFRKEKKGHDHYEDPFFAAFVECSKDEGSKGSSKIRSSSSTGFGGSLYASCLRTCEVADSVVYLRRTSSGYFLR